MDGTRMAVLLALASALVGVIGTILQQTEAAVRWPASAGHHRPAGALNPTPPENASGAADPGKTHGAKGGRLPC